MRRKRELIEIQEPPLEEIKKKRSCIKRSCTSGCGCFAVLVIGFLLVLKFMVHPEVVRLKEVPADFPKIIPIYDTDSVAWITFVDGEERGEALEFAGYIPKIILAPVITILRLEMSIGTPEISNRPSHVLSELFETDLADHRNMVTVAWRDMLATPDFVMQFYETELKNHDFKIIRKENSDTAQRFEFMSDRLGIAGTFLLRDNPEKRGTDEARLTVYY